jgi:hypothetical protein
MRKKRTKVRSTGTTQVTLIIQNLHTIYHFIHTQQNSFHTFYELNSTIFAFPSCLRNKPTLSLFIRNEHYRFC